jgi:hypothetical protein
MKNYHNHICNCQRLLHHATCELMNQVTCQFICFIIPTSQENLAMNNWVTLKPPSPCAFHINNDIKYVGININQLWKHFFLEEIFNNELHFASFEQNMCQNGNQSSIPITNIYYMLYVYDYIHIYVCIDVHKYT